MQAEPGRDEGFVARMRGLPWQATEEDIKKFFHDSKILEGGIILAHNFQGRPTGEAYVQFPTEEDLARALDKHKEDMGHRYIEVFRSSNDEIDKVKTRSALIGLEGEEKFSKSVVRMRGLPYSATVEDILDFFHGLELPSQAVHIATTPDGRPTGEAYVELPTEEEANRAMERHKSRLGTRYIELFRSSRHELMSVLNHHQQQQQQQQQHQQHARFGSYYGGTYPFSGGGGFQYGSHGSSNSLGMLLGLGGSSVESYGENSLGDNFVRMRGLPYSATEGDISAWFNSVGVTPKLIHIVFNSSNRPSGEAYVEFNTPEDCQLAMTKHRDPMGSRYVELFRSSRQELSLGMPAYETLDASLLLQLAGAMQPAAHPVLGQSQLDMMMGWGVPAVDLTPQASWPARAQPREYQAGLTLRMRGLPYRANVQDILEFFRGYQILPESIQFGQEGDGRPSGECWVTFKTNEEGQRALRERNRGHIGARYVELFLA